MKSKLVKKTLAITLAATMVSSMVGCGKQEEVATTGNETAGNEVVQTQENTTPEATTPETTIDQESVATDDEPLYEVLTDADGNVYDLGGMEIIIRDWWSSGEETEPTNAYEEARKEYLDWAEETYNFTIKQMGISSWDSTPEDFANYASTGGDENYAFMVYQGSALVAAMHSGLMYDLSTLDCLDFSEDKWKSGVHKLIAKPDGSIYGMSANTPEPRTGIFFNKRILEEAGVNPDDLYTWQENGEWTWEKFEELCGIVQRDTNNDGSIDVYAMASQGQSEYKAAVFSNGGEFIGMDENGYYNDLESPETLEALNWMVDLRSQYEMPMPADAAWDYYVSVFVQGTTAFCVDDSYRGNNEFSNMEDDFGFVCFPKGPNATDYTNCFADNVIVIPGCYDEQKAWNIAFAYNIYTDPVPGFEDYDGWKSGYYNGFRDTESVDLTLERMVNNGMISYHEMVRNIALGEDLLWSLGYADETGEVATPAQKAESLRYAWQSHIDEANGKK